MSEDSSRHNTMLCPESDEEEFSGSYNINEGNGVGNESDCSDGSSSSSESNSKTAISSSSSESPLNSSNSNLTLDVDDEDTDDNENEDDDDDATTTQSDELELAQLSEQDTFRLPRGLCENANIFHEFFSLETWQMLPTGLQAQLQPLLPDFASVLPPAQAAAERQRTITQLFNGGIQRFGQSPLSTLQCQLEEGNLRPDVLQLRRSIELSKRREARFQQCERLSQLAKELFISREVVLSNAYNTPPDSKSVVTRPRKRKRINLYMDNKFCALRARKRYCLDMYEISRELKIQLDELSAEEEDGDDEHLAISSTERAQIAKEWAPAEGSNFTAPKPSNAADKKCIYNTFFKRRHGVDDEHVLRSMQAAKIPRLNDKNFKKYLRDYKHRKLAEPHLPDFDTSDIRLRDVCTRAQFVGNFKPGRKPKAVVAAAAAAAASTRHNEPPALVPIGAKSETPPLLTDEPQQVYGRAAVEQDIEYESEEIDVVLAAPQTIGSASIKTSAIPGVKPLPKLEPIGVRGSPQLQQASSIGRHKSLAKVASHITGSPTREQHMVVATTETSTHACFFSLLRDFFVATVNHRMTYTELKSHVISWRESHALGSAAPTTLNDWYRAQSDWTLLLQSAINFLAGDFSSLPAEYVPYIEHKTQLNIYQWIGAGRDSDARLLALCNYWLQRRKELKEPTPMLQSGSKLLQQKGVAVATQALPAQLSPVPALDSSMFLASPTPPPRYPTSWTVRTATEAEVLEFQRQERLRFEQPHRPFTYCMYGYESVVGPVKGIYTQTLSLNKARGHTVMVDNRPPYVTILTLVRDATARLPNGEGTRSEISELLKCSQYINPNAAENALQTVVSGALDRMHGGLDPCVRYDAKRKIWIYLHRNRSEEEFERMHKHNQTLVKQKQQHKVQRKVKPKKDEATTARGITSVEKPSAMECMQSSNMPALVPAASVGSTLLIKKPNSNAQVSTKWMPVPPLKYNIPAASAQQQKSLLKTSTASPVRGGVVNIQADKQLGRTTTVKQYNFSLPQPTGTAATKVNAIRNTTPILVTTPTGVQTVHVATNPASQTSSSTNATANAAVKKLTIKKPVIVNQTSTLKQLPNSFIIPMEQLQTQPKEQQNTQHQQQQQSPPTVGTISPRQQLPKNIIRLMPNAAGTTGTATSVSLSQTPSKQGAAMQFIGPRVLAQTTVRPLQMQQKIGAVSIVSNKATGTSPPATATGTIVKMSPQAFATLQQKQLLNKTVNNTQLQTQQPQQQQRILVGSTAISSNKNIVFQALPAAAASTSTASGKLSVAPKILSTAGHTKTINTANLSPQQQRIVLQNFKQQTKTLPTPIIEIKNNTTASAVAPVTTAAASQTTTRVVRTANPAAATQLTQTGQIITLGSLVHKQGTVGKAVGQPNIIQWTSGNNSVSVGHNPTQLVSPPRNVITLTSTGAQRLLPTTATVPTTTTVATQAAAKVSPGRIISANAVPKIIGKTTVLPGNANLQGKPLLLHAKQLSTATTNIPLKSLPANSPAAAALRSTNIVIGGQTVKLQSAPRNAGAVTAGSTTAATTTATPMQTVIMGNQLVRLQVSTATTTALTTSSTTTVASTPKTMVLGSAGQALRIQSNAIGKNVIVSTANNNKAAANATTANNLVFAVQGGGGQLFFSPSLQGVNLKPLSNMKVISMGTAGTTAGGKVTVSTAAATTVVDTAGKTITQKILPQAVLKSGSGAGN